MTITFNEEPRYAIGYKYVNYSDGRTYTVLGYNFSVTKTSDAQVVTTKYITIHDFAQQLLVNNETPESSIARSKAAELAKV